ncbi:hypothetical protein [Mycoavidus sp. B2-EB]|uniref:hypothetical protein n=1 Tax=Mycoavidus sp. B2-EB TaxID=2651972 RepID=UPI00162457BA|nr:hypothetical protein [Mycoavidus sp. B2-EB]BBO59635.1 toxin [Mycoavidus sp. B2-EB]
MTDKISSSFNNLRLEDTDHLDAQTSSASTSSHTSAPARNSAAMLEGLAKRRKFVADESNFEHQFSVDKENEAETSKPPSNESETSKLPSIYQYESEYRKDGGELGYFVNKFKKDKWTFKENYKDKTRDFYASDIARHQYTQVSKRHNFQGKMPKIIKRKNVINESTLDLINRMGSEHPDFQSQFFKSTENGKSTQRIMDDFGLTATNVELKNPGYETINERGEGEGKIIGVDIFVHVKPKDD